MKQRTSAEITQQIYLNVPTAVFGSVFCSIILVFVLRDVVGRKALLGWLTAILLTAALRVVSLAAHKQSLPDGKEGAYWHRWLFINELIVGVVWGSIAIFIFPTNILYQVFMAFMIGGLAAGAVAAFHLDLGIFWAFSIPAIAPIALRFCSQPDEIHIVMGVMCWVYLILLSSIAWRMAKTGKELIELKENLQDMVESRTAELQKTNEELQKEIRERERIQRALKESEEKYRILVENANDTVFIVQDDLMKFHNRRTQELTGYSSDELARIPFIKHVHLEDRDRVMERYLRRLEGEDPESTYSFRVITKSGNMLWGELNATKVIWEGKPAVLCVVRDVTQQRKLEEHLSQVQKLESIGVLAGGIAHDFNNLLAAIMGNISLARMETDSKTTAFEFLLRAEAASLRARELTQQLLTFSKGGLPVKKATSVEELIEATSKFALQGSKSKCRFEIDRGLWLAEVDPGQINQVIHNLVLNADHAMPEGGVITIGAENVKVTHDSGIPVKTGKYVKISIEDKGVGIEEDDLPRIFDPYFSTKENGTGLGLAITYSIVKKHGGYINIRSVINNGTTVELFLPATSRAVADHDDMISEIVVGTGRVLVMDDEEIVREVAEEMLTKIGYEVQVADSGEEAIRLYSESYGSGNPFDVVILDLTVPGAMGGKEAIKILSQIDPDVKAVVASGYSNDPVLSQYKKHGFQGILAKPYQLEEMSQLLYRLLPQAKKDN